MKELIAVMKILSIIEAVVQTVERAAAIKGGLTGKEKLTAALAMLENVWNGLAQNGGIKEMNGIPFESVRSIVTVFVNAIVRVYNVTQVFTTKGGTTPSPTSTPAGENLS